VQVKRKDSVLNGALIGLAVGTVPLLVQMVAEGGTPGRAPALLLGFTGGGCAGIGALIDYGPSEFGVAELPLDGASPRYTPLLSATINKDDSGGVFQLDPSHDQRTIAAASTFLGISGGSRSRMKPEDCALYLVDLSRADRRVTKVPVAVPPAPKTQANGG
jgi:hypothetical protein